MQIVSKFGWFAQVAVGLIFLLAGAVKVWEPVVFYWQTMPYLQLLHIPEEIIARLTHAVLLLAPLEVALGLALIINWRPRLTYCVATALLIVFLAVTLSAWGLGAGIDCGCFGSLIERGPGQAALEDTVFVGLLVFARWGAARWPVPTSKMGWPVVTCGLAAALMIGGVRYFHARDRLAASDLHVGQRLTGLSLSGLDQNLSDGEYLIELFSPDCRRCRKEARQLNLWSATTDLPRIVALTESAQDSPVLQNFKLLVRPRYQIATIAKTDFLRLTWRHRYPRLAYVRDGIIRKVWEYDEFPSADELTRTIERLRGKNRFVGRPGTGNRSLAGRSRPQG